MCVKGSVLPFLACLNVDFVLTDRTELSLGPTNRPQQSQTYIIQCINIVVVTCNHLPDAGYCTCCCFSALTCSRRSLVDTAQIKMGLSERACVLVHLWRLIGFCNIPEIVNGDHSFLTFNNGFLNCYSLQIHFEVFSLKKMCEMFSSLGFLSCSHSFIKKDSKVKPVSSWSGEIKGNPSRDSCRWSR